MKKIPLTKGQFTIVDDEDFEELSKFKWCAQIRGNVIYAARRGVTKMIYLHRQILNISDQKIRIDHINCDGLDNRKSNIRISTAAQNSQNVRKRSDNTSGYKGVWWHKIRGKWECQVVSNGKKYAIGYFSSKEDAAKAYDEAVIKYHGEFARTNF